MYIMLLLREKLPEMDTPGNVIKYLTFVPVNSEK
jgi:hypothetical protein